MTTSIEIKEELNLVSTALLNARDVYIMLNSEGHSDAGLARVTWDALNKYYLQLEKDLIEINAPLHNTEPLSLPQAHKYLPYNEVKY